MNTVSISPGNIKMGAIPSVSLPAILTCRADAPCARLCYGNKIENLRKTVHNAYMRNYELLLEDENAYFTQLLMFCKMQRYFRWHVSGDIVDAAYFEKMVGIARQCPHCDFLCFTKKYEIVNDYLNENELPDNIHVIMSNWGDFKSFSNPHGLPVAEVIFKGQEPNPEWKVCGGNCTDCACRGVGCWEIKPGETIAFYQH